jgi:hypothetical protein
LKKQIKQAITDHPKVAAAVIVGLTGEATEALVRQVAKEIDHKWPAKRLPYKPISKVYPHAYSVGRDRPLT